MKQDKTPQQPWLEAAQAMQQWASQWQQLSQNLPGAQIDPSAAFKAFMPSTGAANPMNMPFPSAQMGGASGMQSLESMFSQAAGKGASIDPAQWIEIQQTYLKEVAELWNQGLQAKPQGDRR